MFYTPSLDSILILYPGNKQLPWLIPTGKKLVLSNTNEVKIKLVIPELDYKNYQIRWGLQGSYKEPSINSSVYRMRCCFAVSQVWEKRNFPKRWGSICFARNHA